MNYVSFLFDKDAKLFLIVLAFLFLRLNFDLGIYAMEFVGSVARRNLVLLYKDLIVVLLSKRLS